MSKHYSSLYDFDDATVGLQALAAFVVVQEAKGDFSNNDKLCSALLNKIEEMYKAFENVKNRRVK